MAKSKSSSSDSSKDKDKSKSESYGGSSSKDKSGGSSSSRGGSSSSYGGGSSKDKSGSSGSRSVSESSGSSSGKTKSVSESSGSSSGKTKDYSSPSSSGSSGKTKSPSSGKTKRESSGGSALRSFLGGGTRPAAVSESSDPRKKMDAVSSAGPSWEQFQDFNELSPMPSLENLSPAQQILLTDPGAIDQVIAGFEPFSALQEQLGGFLAEGNRHREERIAERQAAGVTPSPGPIDWNAIFYDLNAPKRERGVEFEGPVDWGGIGNAIGGMFGGLPEALAAPAPRLAEPPRQVPGTNFGGFVERGGAPPRFAVDPESGFVQDPRTGTYYPPDVLEAMIAEDPAALTSPAVQDALAVEAQRVLGTGPAAGTAPRVTPGMAATVTPGATADRLAPSAAGIVAPGVASTVAPTGIAAATELAVGLPRRDPRGYLGAGPIRAPEAEIVAETLMPGMVPGAQPQTPGAPRTREPTMWENVVDMAGSVADNTLLGTAVKHLFPDIWYGAGEALKGHGGMGGTLRQDSYPLSGGPVQPSESSGEGGTRVGFVDKNKNDIDDRLETPTPTTPLPPPIVPPPNQPPPGTVSPTEYDRWGEVVFPDLPPYSPGIDPEWLYFRKRYANGGIVDATSPNNPGPASGIDPRIVVIADAEDALAGRHPEPERAIRAFVELFGEEALEALRARIGSEGRLIEGPGGPKDDAIPAVIEGREPAALSDGEYVLSAAAVEGAGDGDREEGAAQLAQLDAMLAARA